MTVFRIRPPDRRQWLAFLLASLVATVLLTPAALKDERLSMYDEATHLDNAWRWSHFDIPQKGEQISREILSEWTCRGFYDSKVNFPECTPVEGLDDVGFPLSLSNYNTKHPPIYYVVNGFVARGLVALTPIDSFVSAARIANGLWAGLVFVVAVGLFGRLGLGRRPSVVLAVLAVLIPVAFLRWTYVNNDVASYASAWIIAAVALRFKEFGFERGVRLLALASLFGTLTKGFTIGAVVAATIIMLPVAWSLGDRFTDRRRNLATAMVPGFIGGLGVIGWLVIQRLYRSDIPYKVPFVREPPDGWPWAKISAEVIRVTAPVGELPTWMYSVNPFLNTSFDRWLEVLAWLMSAAAAALVMGVAAQRESYPFRSLGVGTLAGPPVLAAIVVSYNMLDGSPVFIRIQDRYHVSVLPFFLIALGAVMASRKGMERPVTWFVSAGLVAQLAIYAIAI